MKMKENGNQIIYIMMLFGVFFLYARGIFSPIGFSIYSLESPITILGQDTITRGDLFTTIEILYMSSFLVTFLILVRRRLFGGKA